MTDLLKVCAWCGKHLNDSEPGPDGDVTHGICPECKKRVEEDLPCPRDPFEVAAGVVSGYGLE